MSASRRDAPTAAPAAAAPGPGLRVLLVSYQFPPVGGAGVVRVHGLAKYLPAHGVTPAVLAASNASSPLCDPGMAEDLPAGLEIVRVRTLEPSYAVKAAVWRSTAATEAGRPQSLARRWLARAARGVLVPDPQVLWIPAAQAALARRLARGADDAVVISGPPFSQFLLAGSCRLRRGTAVVLDYRDEWITYRRAHEMMSATAAAAGALLEPALVRAAHAITTATEAFREALLARFPFLDPALVRAIPNGYDPDDLDEARPPDAAVDAAEAAAGRFRLTYAGTVFSLTNARTFLAAVRRLHEREPELARRLEVRFIGRIAETEAESFAGSEAIGVRCLGPMDHRRVLNELRRSHAALCLLDEAPGTERLYPVKIFELMALRRPALVLAPPGALRQLVLRHRAGDVVPPRDEAAVAATLERYLRAFRDGTWRERSEPVDIEPYDQRALAGDFARVLADAVAVARAG